MRAEVSSKHLFTTTCLHHSLQVHTQHTAMYTTRRVLALHTLLLNASSLSTRVQLYVQLKNSTSFGRSGAWWTSTPTRLPTVLFKGLNTLQYGAAAGLGMLVGSKQFHHHPSPSMIMSSSKKSV